MAIVTADYIRPAKKLGLNATPSIEGPEAAAETFLKGAILVPAAGYLSEAGADPTAILGIALEPGNNDVAAGTSKIGYCPALPGMIFVGAIAAAAAIAQADLFAEYGVVQDGGTGVWCVDKAEAVNTRVTIIGFKDPVGTVNGKVYFVFNADGRLID